MSERRQGLLSRGFQEIGAQIDGRAFGERASLVRGGGAKARLEMRRQPLGKIARHMRRRAGKVRSHEAGMLRSGQLRRRMAFAGEQRGDGFGVEAAGLLQRAQDFGARGRFADQPGGRAFPAQRVVDEARNRRPVA